MSGAIVFIPLTQSMVATIDFEDFERVRQHKWHTKKDGRGLFYVATKIRTPEGKRKTLRLHRFLMPEAVGIDHISGDGLDNRRTNLREATRSQNQHGFKRKKRNASSNFRGVCWHGRDREWRAQIRVNGKVIDLGHFQVEEEAARAYDRAAVKFFGGFASPNFPNSTETTNRKQEK
jgi:AP2 domain/HNH endonuclease